MNYIREASEYLKNYRNLKIAHENLVDEVTKLKADLSGYKAINYSDMPHGTSIVPDDTICNLMFRFDKTKEQLAENKKALARIEKSLSQLTDEERKVLEAYYVDELSDVEAAQKLHMSRATFYRVKGKAIRTLAVQLFGIKVIE